MKIIQRLSKYIEFKGISLNAFDISIGASNGYIGKAIKNSGSIGGDVIEKISEIYTDLSLIWLITGKGEMLGAEEPVTTSTAANSSTHIYKELYLEKEKEIRELNREIGEMRAELAYLKNEVLAYERACLQKPVAEPELELKE